jgi:spore germination protein KC
MRRRAALLAALLLLLSGCWSRVEVTDLAVVVGMGVDKGENAPVRVTLLVSRTVSGGGKQEQRPAGGDPTWVVAREAQNVNDAMRQIVLASARRISLHHIRVVLIGEEYAREDVGGLLDYMVRSPQIRLMTRPMVVQGTAQEVFETPPQLEMLQSENLVEIVQAKGGVDQRLKEFAVARISETHSGWMYMLKVIDKPARNPGAPERAVEFSGAALFLKDKMVAMADRKLAQALLWLLNNPTQGIISSPCPNDPAKSMSGRIEEGRTKIIPVLTGNKLSFQVLANGRVDLVRTDCGVDVIQSAVRGRLEKQLGDDLAARIQELVALFKEKGIDPVGFGKYVQLKQTAYWRTVADKWPQPMKEVPVKVTTKITIQHTGLLLEPSNLTDRELKAKKK